MTSSTNLPLIDMSGVREGDQASIRRAGDAIRKACSETGFFYIINHGVPQTVIDTAMSAPGNSLPIRPRSNARWQ